MQPESSKAAADATKGLKACATIRSLMAGPPYRRRSRRRTFQFMRVHPALAVTALEQAPHDHEEHRHEKDGEHRGRDHSAHHAGADRTLARRARSRRDD